MQVIDDAISSVLEASVVVSPRDHGLSREEVFEIAERFGFKRGEIGDALARISRGHLVGAKLRIQHLGPNKLSNDFNWGMDPELRDVNAFNFVRTELIELAREVGEQN